MVIFRGHRWLVEKVEPSGHPKGDTVVGLACLDDDANGQRVEVLWEREVDAQVLGETTGTPWASGALISRRCSAVT